MGVGVGASYLNIPFTTQSQPISFSVSTGRSTFTPGKFLFLRSPIVALLLIVQMTSPAASSIPHDFHKTSNREKLSNNTEQST